jgi:hypothetical protein
MEQLVALGLLRPGPGCGFGPGDLVRVRLVEATEHSGIALHNVAAAIQPGEVLTAARSA